MGNIIFAMKDLFKHYFDWHGRLSRAGYWWAWLGVTVITLILQLITNFVSGSFEMLTVIWSLAVFFPMMFATMRRYHDSGKPGFLVVIFNLAGGALAIVGIAGSAVILLNAIAYSAGMEMLMGMIAFQAVLLLLGLALTIVNFVFLVLPSSPVENAYGSPRPFDINEGKDTEDEVGKETGKEEL